VGFHDFDPETPIYSWYTGCSEQWNVTGTIMYWLPISALPPVPKIEG